VICICARKSDRCSEKWYCAQRDWWYCALKSDIVFKGLVIGARKSGIVLKGIGGIVL
jgi:hypothetical protein